MRRSGHRHVGQDVIDERGSTVDHATGAARGAETSSSTLNAALVRPPQHHTPLEKSLSRWRAELSGGEVLRQDEGLESVP